MVIDKAKLDEWKALTQQADIRSQISMNMSDALRHAMGEIERLSLDARRYRRLRIIGAAPCNTPQLASGTVMCFSNLDKFVDADIEKLPSRGEDKLELLRAEP